MKYKWLLFDADDTLFDYNKAEYTALGKTFEENGLHCSDPCRERYREINLELFKEHEKGIISSNELRIVVITVSFSFVASFTFGAYVSTPTVTWASSGWPRASP